MFTPSAHPLHTVPGYPQLPTSPDPRRGPGELPRIVAEDLRALACPGNWDWLTEEAFITGDAGGEADEVVVLVADGEGCEGRVGARRPPAASRARAR